MSSLRDKMAAKKDAIAASKAGGVKTYKFKVGKTLIRILPDRLDPVNGEPWRDYGQHFIKDENDNLFAVIGDKSLVTGGAETCPVREALLAAAKGAPQELRDHIFKKVIAKLNHISNVAVLGLVGKDNKLVQDPDAPSDTPVLVSWSPNQLSELIDIFTMYMDNGEEPFDLAGGVTIMVTREGTGQNDTKYTYNAYPRKFPVKPEVMEKAYDLDAWIAATFKEGAARALEGIAKITGSIAGPVGAAAAALTAPPSGAANASLAKPAEKPALVSTVVDDEIDLGVDEAVLVEEAEYAEVVVEAETPAATAPAAAETVTLSESDVEALLSDL